MTLISIEAASKHFTQLKAVIFVLALGLSAISPAKETVRLAAGEWKPYVSSSMNHYGHFSRIVTQAFALEGVDVEYGFFPWKRSMLIAAQGAWDGTLPWGYQKDRIENFHHSESVTMQRYFFFHLKRFEFDWKSYRDLRGITIGASSIYNYKNEFQHAEKEGEIKVVRVGTESQLIKLLLAGRIQLALIERRIAQDLMCRSFSPEETDQITYHPKLQSEGGLHLLLSNKHKRNQGLIEKFNRGLKRLQTSGKANLEFLTCFQQASPRMMEQVISP